MQLNTIEDFSNDFNDYYEKTKYQLTYRLSIAVATMLLILGITFIILKEPVIYLTAAGFAACIGFVVYMRLTKKYKLAAILFTLTGSSLSILTLLTIKDAFHFVDPLWMLIVALFAYFTLGKVFGNIILITEFLAVAYYLIFNLNENLELVEQLSTGELYSLALNCFLCAIVIAYLIYQFLRRNAFAANSYRKLTQELHSKNLLVESQNREKTAMLKEIHHRVKNNLQVITSLLRLQTKDMENPESVNHFKEAIGRIGAMALIHNQMYQSKDLDRIDIEAYLQSLSKNILSSYTLDIPVNLNFDIKIKHFDSDQIVSLALLFNELVSNSLKHAFKHKDRGIINTSIRKLEGSKIEFIFNDNGDWVQPKSNDSFGLELIETLVEQMNGSIKRNSDQGTQYEFLLDVRSE